MSIEKAIEIFTANNCPNPQAVVETFQKAESLDALRPIVRSTHLSAGQYVSVRMVQLFKGDPEFASNTLENAKVTLSEYGLLNVIVEEYISKGGGEDVATPMRFDIELGKYGVEYDEIKTTLEEFFRNADEYLFEALKSYVTDSPS